MAARTASPKTPRLGSSSWRSHVGRYLARLLCAVFAAVGAVPLLAGWLAHSPAALDWAARESSRLLEDELGIEARYRVELGLWPLQIALHDLVVPATDGGAPALRVGRLSVRPRVLSLLAGRLDAGDIEAEGLEGRLVIRHGKLTNLAYRLPKAREGAGKRDQPPFTSLAVSDGRFDLDLEGTRVVTTAVNLAVLGESGPAFDVVLRAGKTTVVREHETTIITPRKGGKKLVDRFHAVDEDVLCSLDLRARAAPGEVLVRSLSASGVADFDPARSTVPRCLDAPPVEDPHRLALGLTELRIRVEKGAGPLISGHVEARAPVGLTNRFVKMVGLSGWVGITADVRYEGKTRLPELTGRILGQGLHLGPYKLAKELDVELEVAQDRLRIAKLAMGIADGTSVVEQAEIAPFAPGAPLSAKRVTTRGMQFSGLMRDVDVTPRTIVNWGFNDTEVRDLTGTLAPLKLDGKVRGDTRDFEVFDRAFSDPERKHMIGVPRAVLEGGIGVRPEALEFYDTTVLFGHSRLQAKLVSIGFHNHIRVELEPSTIQLEDVSPITDIPWAGKADLELVMAGRNANPLLTGDLKIDSFVFGGFPVGDIQHADVRFRPLAVELSNVRATKGKSEYLSSSTRLDFNRKGALIVDSTLTSPAFDLRDFFHIFHFEEDPRFADLRARGALQGSVHYEVGGPRDRCGGGYLRVQGEAQVDHADLYEELYDAGRASFDFEWTDKAAGYRGATLEVPSFSLHKGTGTILGSVSMTPGSKLAGNVVATGIPLAEIQALGPLGALVEAKASAVAAVSGSIDALAFDSQVTVTPTKVGGAVLPASSVSVRLVPRGADGQPPGNQKDTGRTRCGQPLPAPFDQAEYDRDPSEGTYVAEGQLFGGQVQLENLRVSRQRYKSVAGRVVFSRLDLGALAQLSPAVALAEPRPQGAVSAALEIKKLRLSDPARASAVLTLSNVEFERSGVKLTLQPGAMPISIAGGTVSFPGLTVAIAPSSGPTGIFHVAGEVRDLPGHPLVDGRLVLRPVELASLATLSPEVERAQGTIRGDLRIQGSALAPRYSGGFQLENGELALGSFPTPITDLQVRIAVDQSELKLVDARAQVGKGSVTARGGAPLHGFELGDVQFVVTARELALPLAEGIETMLDAELTGTYEGSSADDEAASAEERAEALPRVVGSVTLHSFEYTRPITMSADLASLTQRGRRTSFEDYDPANDTVEFAITLRSDRPLMFSNNLVEASLVLPQSGLLLEGTDQRFGVRGTVQIPKGGHLWWRQHDFEIQQGQVRFSDATRIAPEVDVRATTEYHRYAESFEQNTRTGPQPSGAAPGSIGPAAAGGRWLITLHAYGDADALKVDLTSQPPMGQDDLFLLLTMGLTRAELDQARSASVGSSVALETLGTLSGADRAVTEVVPVIDEFRFGSQYSSRTGRTEPTITIGKRLADRIRASVTSGLSDSREVRSNLELQVAPRVSVEGSYDNVNDISTASLGNLGADLRWRLEFE